MLETHFDVSGFPGAYWAADGAELDADALRCRSWPPPPEPPGPAFHPAPVTGLELGGSGVVVETDEGPVRAAIAVVATEVGAGPPRARAGPEAAPGGRPAGCACPWKRAPRFRRPPGPADGRVDVAGDRRASSRWPPPAVAPAAEGAEVLERLAARLPVRAEDASRWEAPREVSRGRPAPDRRAPRPSAGRGLRLRSGSRRAWPSPRRRGSPRPWPPGPTPRPAALRAGREPARPGPGLSRGAA